MRPYRITIHAASEAWRRRRHFHFDGHCRRECLRRQVRCAKHHPLSVTGGISMIDSIERRVRRFPMTGMLTTLGLAVVAIQAPLATARASQDFEIRTLSTRADAVS